MRNLKKLVIVISILSCIFLASRLSSTKSSTSDYPQFPWKQMGAVKPSTTAVMLENFELYTVGTFLPLHGGPYLNPQDTGTWSNNNGSGITGQASIGNGGKYGYFTAFNDIGNFTFVNAHSFITGMAAFFEVKGTSENGDSVYISNTAGTARAGVQFAFSSHEIKDKSGSHVLCSYSDSSWYSIVIILLSPTLYDVVVNGTRYTNGVSHYTRVGAGSFTEIDKVSISIGNGIVYIDNIGIEDSYSTFDSNSAGDEWLMYRHGLNHTGYINTSPVSSNSPIWVFQTNHTNPNTGLPGGYVRSSSAIYNGWVYFACMDTYMYCLNATNGVEKWSTGLGQYPEHSSPAIANGRVYVGGWGGGSSDSCITCVNITNGNILWTSSMVEWAESSPCVFNGCVYFGSHDHNVYCINGTNGASIWSYDAGDEIDSSPAVEDGLVFIGRYAFAGSGEMICLNASDGSLKWTKSVSGSIDSSPCVVNKRVYFGCIDGNVFCLNESSGVKIWNYTTIPGGVIESSPAIYNGRLFIGSDDHQVYCLNANNGSKIWNYTTGNMLEMSSPAISNDLLFIGGLDKELKCLYTSNGSIKWIFVAGGWILDSPAICNGKVYVGSDAGGEYCLPMKLGVPFFNATVPGLPRNLTATPGIESVNLTWVIPSSNGGASIMHYDVYQGTSSGCETFLLNVGNVTSCNISVVAGGIYYYEVTAVNVMGEGPANDEISVAIGDWIPPVTIPSVNRFIVLGGMPWICNGSVISLSAVDNGSGVNETWYKYTGFPWTRYIGPFSINESDGMTISFSWCSWDNAGNNETLNVIPLEFDNLPPNTTLSYTAAFPPYFATPVTNFSLGAIDTETGVNSTWYRYPGIAWTLYAGAFTLNATSGEIVIEYYSRDQVGNNETVRNATVYLDTTAPITNLAYIPRYSPDFVTLNTVFTLSAIDAGSGVNSTWYRYPGIAWTRYMGPFTINTTSGAIMIEYWSNDSVGNSYLRAPNSTIVKLDDIAPTSNIQQYSATTITLSAIDTGSGVAIIQYSINGSAWMNYTTPIVFNYTMNEDIAFSYRSIDNCGNVEATWSTTLHYVVSTPSPPSPYSSLESMENVAAVAVIGFIAAVAVINVIKKRKG